MTDQQLNALINLARHAPFTFVQAQRALDVPVNTLHALIEHLLNQHILQRLSGGRAPVFRLNAPVLTPALQREDLIVPLVKHLFPLAQTARALHHLLRADQPDLNSTLDEVRSTCEYLSTLPHFHVVLSDQQTHLVRLERRCVGNLPIYRLNLEVTA